MGTTLQVIRIMVGSNNATTKLTCAYSECAANQSTSITLTSGTYSVTNTQVSQDSNVYIYKVTSFDIPCANSDSSITGTIKLTFYVTIDNIAKTVTLITESPQQPTSTANMKILSRITCRPGAPPISCTSITGNYDNITVQLSNFNTVKLPLFSIGQYEGRCTAN